MPFISRIEKYPAVIPLCISRIFHNGIRGELAVKLAFHTKELRTLCESQFKAERAIGIEDARKLRGFLADLDIAETLADIPVEQLGEREDGLLGEYDSSIIESYVVRMRVNHPGMHRSKLERLDRSMVRRIMIMDIEKIEVARG